MRRGGAGREDEGVRGKERDKRRRRGRKGLEFWAKGPGFYHHCGSSSPPTAGNDTSLAQHPSLHPVLQGNLPGFQLFIKVKLSSVITASFVGCQHFFFYFKIKLWFDSHSNDGSGWKPGAGVRRQVQLQCWGVTVPMERDSFQTPARRLSKGWRSRRLSRGRMDTGMQMAESLCCPPEAITTLSRGYGPMLKKN